MNRNGNGPAGPPPRVHAYARVSTVAQAADGESLGAQERRLRAYAALHWGEGASGDGDAEHPGGEASPRVVLYVDRGVSAAKPLVERPEGARLLAELAPGDVVVATKLDRMFRSALDALSVLEGLRERGISLHLIDMGGDVTGNGIARLMFTVLAACAEMERERIRERIRDVKRDQRARGRWLGGRRPPFGWRVGDGGILEEDEREQASLRVAREMHGRGASLRRIAAVLRERGTPLSYQGVGKALRRGDVLEGVETPDPPVTLLEGGSASEIRGDEVPET